MINVNYNKWKLSTYSVSVLGASLSWACWRLKPCFLSVPFKQGDVSVVSSQSQCDFIVFGWLMFRLDVTFMIDWVLHSACEWLIKFPKTRLLGNSSLLDAGQGWRCDTTPVCIVLLSFTATTCTSVQKHVCCSVTVFMYYHLRWRYIQHERIQVRSTSVQKHVCCSVTVSCIIIYDDVVSNLRQMKNEYKNGVLRWHFGWTSTKINFQIQTKLTSVFCWFFVT